MNRAAAMLRDDVPATAELESLQTGRAIREMRAQLLRLPEWLEYFAALVRTEEGRVPPFKGPYLNYVKRVPLGVVGQITPWNHPMLIAIKKIAPAIAAGNSVVVKPSELAPVTVLRFAELCSRAGLPDGVLNVVPGASRRRARSRARAPARRSPSHSSLVMRRRRHAQVWAPRPARRCPSTRASRSWTSPAARRLGAWPPPPQAATWPASSWYVRATPPPR